MGSTARFGLLRRGRDSGLMDLLFLGFVIRARHFWRMLPLRAMCSECVFKVLIILFILDTGFLLGRRLFCLGIGEEIGNVALVFFAVDGDDEIGRIVAHFSNFLGDGVALELAFIRFQNGLQFFRPGLSTRIEPYSHLFTSIVHYHRHPVMEEFQIRV